MLTGHALVLLAVSRDAHIRIRDIAASTGLTERWVQKVLAELVRLRIVTITHEGRRCIYQVHRDARIGLPVVGKVTVGSLLKGLVA
jgi:DNA-binding IscR family transcriptional regulator